MGVRSSMTLAAAGLFAVALAGCDWHLPGKPVKIKYRLVIGAKEQDSDHCEDLSKEFVGR